MRNTVSQLPVLLCIAVLALSGCATQGGGNADYDKAHDFSAYETFSWISDNPMKTGPMLRDPRDSLEPTIMGAIQASLEGKGFRMVERSQSPNFVVSFTVGSREKVRPAGYPSMKPEAGGRWSWGSEYHGGEEGAKYTQGVLAIDVFDVAEKRPVWHAVTGKRVDDSDVEDVQKVIDEAVSELLSSFPP